MNATSKLLRLERALRNYRNFHVTNFTRSAAAYEGPGKTTITFLRKEIGRKLLVTYCDENGFMLNTGSKTVGPTVIFPSHAICWNIMNGSHINKESLSLFTILEPKPDLLVIGLDDTYDFTYYQNLRALLKKHDIPSEILSVRNACAVFNFVNEEGRFVIAALIPQKIKRPLRLRLSQDQPKKQITHPSDDMGRETDSAKTNAK